MPNIFKSLLKPDALAEEKGITSAANESGELSAKRQKEQVGLRKTMGREERVARYRDPKTGDTWTGLGRAPRWILGRDRKPFEI